MLELLTIEDFQAHRQLSIELDPAVTTIVGPSDAGKSAVIRSLIWLATNRPLGDSFIRDGGGPARVTLYLDHHEVVRTRGKSTNTYSIDGKELKAFGNDVPEEVSRLLNLSPVNLQGQHDSPFWFSETAGEVSRQLNQIVDLSIIDRTLANLDKASRENKAEIRALEKQEEVAKANRSALSWARKAQKDLQEVEDSQERWQSVQGTHQKATERVRAVRLHREALRQADGQQTAAYQVLHAGEYWEKVRDQAVSLRRTIQIAKTSQEEIHLADSAGTVLKTGDLWEESAGRASRLRVLTRDVRRHLTKSRQPVPDLVDLVQLSEAAVEAVKRVKQLRVLVTSARHLGKEARKAGKELKETRELFHEQIGEECPLCGTKIKS